MRFLRIADVPDSRTGGMTRFMRYIGDELEALGHEVEFIFHDDLALECPDRLRRFLAPLRVVKLVRERMRAGERYDAVEIHEPLGAAYGLARRMDRSLPPMVLVSYGVERRCLRTTIDYYRTKGTELPLRQELGWYSVVVQTDLAIKLADQVTVESTEDRDYLEAHGIPRDRVTIVNGGVTGPFLGAPDASSAGGGVLFLGSWIDRKGVLDLVPAVSKALEARPGLHFTAAGFLIDEAVVRRAFPQHLQGRIATIPKVSGEVELLALYRRHSVFAAPSFFEGQLLTMLEAAAAGLAVIATRTCGMKDFVDDGQTGLLVDVAQPEALGAAILRLWDDPELTRRLATAGQARARTFTWARSAEQFLEAVAGAKK